MKNQVGFLLMLCIRGSPNFVIVNIMIKETYTSDLGNIMVPYNEGNLFSKLFCPLKIFC